MTERYKEPLPAVMDTQAFVQVVETRRAVRKFTPKPVPDGVLKSCIDMALLAPNSSNLQPWRFVVVRDERIRQQLTKACMGQNAARTAPVLVVALGRTNTWKENAKAVLNTWPMPTVPKLVSQYYGKLVNYHYEVGPLGSFGLVKRAVNEVVGRKRAVPRGPFTPADMRLWAAKTCALACENFMLAARAHNFDTCPLEGFDEDKIKACIKVPTDAFVVMVIAMGERTEDGVYYPRQRLPQDHVVEWL